GAAAEARKGAGAAAGAGSEQVPVDAATVDGKHAAVDRGWRGGAGARAVRAKGPGEVRRAVHDTGGGGQDRRAGSALHGVDFARHGAAVRIRTGVLFGPGCECGAQAGKRTRELEPGREAAPRDAGSGASG